MSFSAFASAHPVLAIFLISVGITFFTTLVQKVLTDQEMLRELKGKQNELKNKIKESKDKKEKMDLQTELANVGFKMMKHSMKPLLITLIPLLLFFSFLTSFFKPLLGGMWVFYYILFSVLSSSFIRKALNVV